MIQESKLVNDKYLIRALEIYVEVLKDIEKFTYLEFLNFLSIPQTFFWSVKRKRKNYNDFLYIEINKKELTHGVCNLVWDLYCAKDEEIGAKMDNDTRIQHYKNKDVKYESDLLNEIKDKSIYDTWFVSPFEVHKLLSKKNVELQKEFIEVLKKRIEVLEEILNIV